MTGEPVVSNASPLIALGQIGQLTLLERLFSSVLIPPAVVSEIAQSVPAVSFISEHALCQPIGPRILRASLGPGESEAIALALEVSASWIVLDERAARRDAQALGLSVIGTLGILFASKRRGFLAAIRPCLTGLRSAGFRVAPALYDLVLADADEMRE